MTTGKDCTWIATIMDPESGGWLTEIAVRADRAATALRRLRGAGVHKRSLGPGARLSEDRLPWPTDPTVVFLRRRFGLGEDADWRPVETDRLL